MILRIAVAAVLMLAPLLRAQQSPHPDPLPEYREREKEDSTDPEAERKTFKVTDGFEVNLFASDPMIAKPIQMNFDAAGRLWVASSSQYPQIKPGEAPADKVIVLEDADGDGRAEKSTVFAEGLLIPTGLAPDSAGGVYVANSTEMLYLKDTNGDGKADERRVVLSGFGTEDTHHLIHTFRWGVDGRLYFNQSIYIHSHVETPKGVRRLEGGGEWRFRPETSDLEVVWRGMLNSWGQVFDEWGQAFGVDGAGDGGIYYTFNGSAFPTAVGYERVLHGLNPGSPKYCGLEIVSGRHLPDDWQGNAIANDFRANRVVRFKLSDVDGSYVSKQMPDVITSTDVAFRPVDVQMGPDGAIYIADWYNPIINHGEVDFRDPRRDKVHGRIWRVTAKGRPLVARPRLIGAPVVDLLEQLKSPEGWTRQQAKNVLRSMGKEKVLPELEKWAPTDEHDRVEVLWVYQALDVPNAKLLGELLSSAKPQAAAAAAHVVADWANRLPDAVELLAKRVVDQHPRVRLEAVRSLARMRTPRAIEVALRALDQPKHADVDFALWSTAKETESVWLPALASGEITFDGKPARAVFALQAAKSAAASVELAKLLRDGKVAKDQQAGAFETIAAVGGDAEARVVYDIAIAERTDDATRSKALEALEKSIRRGVFPRDAKGDGIAKFVCAKGTRVSIAAMRVAGAWHIEAVRPELMEMVKAKDASADARQAAIGALVDLGGDSADFLRQLDSSKNSQEIRVAAIVGLASLDLKDAAKLAADLLAASPKDADPAALVSGILKCDGGGAALGEALASKKLSKEIAAAALKHVESTGREEPKLTNRLRSLAGMPAVAAVKSLSKEEMAKKVADIQRYGDAARGEAIFRRADTGCFKCHAIQGAGGQLGPDLGSIGASSPVDYLIESMLDPNKAIKDGYNSVIVATNDGNVHSGIKVSQEDTQMILRDALNDRIVIPKASVKNERPGGSLMPTGLIDHLPSWEQTNLLRFLSELGKPGPFQSGNPNLIRRWRVLPAAAADALVNDASPLASSDRAAALAWTPAYSLVNGDLPADAMAADGQQVAFVRGEIEVTAAGRIGVRINDVKGLSIWVDEKPVDATQEIEVDVARGTHTLTFKVDLGLRGAGLGVEVRDLPGSQAHARPVGGR